MTERTQREDETRATETRPSDDYLPQSVLPVPKPEPGYTFRWIRTSMIGQADNLNVSRKFRERWVPVKADDYKDLNIMSDVGSRFAGNIEVGGLLLCKAPVEFIDSRKRYYDKMAGDQMRAVDESYMRDNDQRMPMLQPERESRTSFGPRSSEDKGK